MAGNLTANGITIETAKGALADALTDLGAGRSRRIAGFEATR